MLSGFTEVSHDRATSSATNPGESGMPIRIIDAVLFGIQITGVSVHAMAAVRRRRVHVLGRSLRRGLRLDPRPVRHRQGIAGWGEWLRSAASRPIVRGAREGLRILAPLALGLDPRHHSTLTAAVDNHMAGHPTPSRRSTWRHGTRRASPPACRSPSCSAGVMATLSSCTAR
jgi:hypothetical protein